MRHIYMPTAAQSLPADSPIAAADCCNGPDMSALPSPAANASSAATESLVCDATAASCSTMAATCSADTGAFRSAASKMYVRTDGRGEGMGEWWGCGN